MTDAAACRDTGIEQVSHPEFMSIALAHIAMLPPETEFTGEQIRRLLTREGVVPHHHNAWGALILHAVSQGLLERTGRWTHMRDRRSHARLTPIYQTPPGDWLSKLLAALGF